MTDVFEMDMEKLKQLTLRHKDTSAPWSSKNTEESIRKELHRKTMIKFCLLCRKINIDALHPKAIHVVLLLFCKVKDKRRLLQGFLTHPCCRECPTVDVDWRVLEDENVNINDVFCAMTDWILILNYLTPAVSPELADEMTQDPFFVRLRQSWKVGGLETYYPGTLERLMTACTFMAPHNLSATKMLERLLVGEADSCRDLEFRCLRTTSHFLDVSVDEDESLLNMLQVVPCMVTKNTFFNDMKHVLSKGGELSENQTGTVKRTRLQMRFLAKIDDGNRPREYMESFETWLGQQKFTVTMSRHLQLLLYFIQVQPTAIPREAYAKHFTDTMLGRLQDVKVQSIDATAVTTLIKSLRVYHGNVKDLIDFRSTCLVGFTQHVRANLSLAQILQLYVACFQHPSIMQTCWKSVVPVWTHTTANAVQRFVSTHTFDYTPVIDSVVQCQVQDNL